MTDIHMNLPTNQSNVSYTRQHLTIYSLLRDSVPGQPRWVWAPNDTTRRNRFDLRFPVPRRVIQYFEDKSRKYVLAV